MKLIVCVILLLVFGCIFGIQSPLWIQALALVANVLMLRTRYFRRMELGIIIPVIGSQIFWAAVITGNLVYFFLFSGYTAVAVLDSLRLILKVIFTPQFN